MAKLPEAVNGGMVTSKDPSMLQPGELAYAEMCIYTQDNDHLCRAPGVTTLDQLDVATSVVGLTSCRFEDGTNKLMAMASATAGDTYYWTANAEVNNPTFATAHGPITLGENLVAVQYDNRHYLFNGSNRNMVYLKDAKFRPHGLLPATSPELEFYKFSSDIANGQPFYNVPAAVTATGLYEYWYTEVALFSDGQELESAFDGTPLTVNVTSVSHAPVMKLPVRPKNYELYSSFGAKLSYRVYRSEKKPTETSQLYPIGTKIQDVQWLSSDGSEQTSGVYFADTTTVLASPQNGASPQSLNFRSQRVELVWNTTSPASSITGITETYGTPVGGATLLSALNATAGYIRVQYKSGPTYWHDNAPAGTTSGVFNSITAPGIDALGNPNQYRGTQPYCYTLSLKDFGITPFSGNVVGIEVKVTAAASSAEIADMYVMPCKFAPNSGTDTGMWNTVTTPAIDSHPQDIPAAGIGDVIKPAVRGGALGSAAKYANSPQYYGDLAAGVRALYPPAIDSLAYGGIKNVLNPYLHGTVTVYATGTNGIFSNVQAWIGSNNQPRDGGFFGNFQPANEYVEKQVIPTSSASPMIFGSGGPRGPANAAFLLSPHSWKITDFDANFGVQLVVRFRSNAQRNAYVDIHDVAMRVLYTGSSTKTSQRNKFYDAVSLEIAGTQVPFGANKPAPVSSTGAMFDGSLVVNAISEPNKLYYSVPGYPDYFPTDVYWFELPGVHNDRITYIGTINGRLVVGTRGNLWRINYLPSQDDASFQRGQAVDLISDSVGILNPVSACTFTNANGQLELAFVDANGVYSTDGYSVRKLSQDLLWVGNNGVVPTSVAAGNNIYTYIRGLINDPRTQTLRILAGNRAFIGSYAAIHAKQGGGLKWTTNAVYNRATVSGNDYIAFPNCIHSLRRANGTWLVTYGMAQGQALNGTPADVAGIGGTVLREDSSDTTTFNQPFGHSSVDFPYIKTRAISPNGPGSELAIDGLSLHGFKQTTLGGMPTSLGCSVTADMSFTNAPPSTSITTLPSVANAKANYAGIDGVNGEEVQFKIQMSDRNMFELHGIIMDASDFGEVDTSA